jgi:hypothetical protein
MNNELTNIPLPILMQLWSKPITEKLTPCRCGGVPVSSLKLKSHLIPGPAAPFGFMHHFGCVVHCPSCRAIIMQSQTIDAGNMETPNITPEDLHAHAVALGNLILPRWNDMTDETYNLATT